MGIYTGVYWGIYTVSGHLQLHLTNGTRNRDEDVTFIYPAASIIGIGQ